MCPPHANVDAVVLGPPDQTEKNGNDCEVKTEPLVGTGPGTGPGTGCDCLALCVVFHTVVRVLGLESTTHLQLFCLFLKKHLNL